MPPRLPPEQRRLRTIAEADFQKQIIQVAEMRGWTVAHFHDSRRQVSPGMFVGDTRAKGFPDLVLGRKRPSDLVVWEIKREIGKTTPEQDQWIDILSGVGVEARVVRPSDWDYVLERLR